MPKNDFQKANEVADKCVKSLKQIDNMRASLEDQLCRACMCIIKMVSSMGYPMDIVQENYYLAIRNAIISSDYDPEKQNFASYATNELKNKVMDQIRNENREKSQLFKVKKSTYERNMHANMFENTDVTLKRRIELEELADSQLDMEF